MNAKNNARLYAMPFASVYPAYVTKAERKGRTKAEVDEIIRWLTGHSEASLEKALAERTSVEAFFTTAPALNPARALITGVVCGVRVEEIEEQPMREIAISTSSSTSWRRGRRWGRYSASNGGAASTRGLAEAHHACTSANFICRSVQLIYLLVLIPTAPR